MGYIGPRTWVLLILIFILIILGLSTMAFDSTAQATSNESQLSTWSLLWTIWGVLAGFTVCYVLVAYVGPASRIKPEGKDGRLRQETEERNDEALLIRIQDPHKNYNGQPQYEREINYV